MRKPTVIPFQVNTEWSSVPGWRYSLHVRTGREVKLVSSLRVNEREREDEPFGDP